MWRLAAILTQSRSVTITSYWKCSTSRIGIVGAGHLGAVLAQRLVANDHSVKIANSRGPHTLTQLARRTGSEPACIPGVAAGLDVNHRDSARTGRETAGIVDRGASETVWVAGKLRVSVVKAFNNITDDSLARNGRPNGARDRIALPVSGDDPGRRATAMRLIDTLGFDAYGAGPLARSWRQQIGQAAYCTDPDRAELERLLEHADPRAVARRRQGAMRIAARMPDDFAKADLTRAARRMAGMDRVKPGNWLSLARLAMAMLVKR